MYKTRVKLAEYPNHIKGYGLTVSPSEEDEWELIFRTLTPSQQYLKHFRQREEIVPLVENEDGVMTALPLYESKNFSYKIERCILTYYITIYYQDKNES